MRILLTGSSGFVGAAVMRQLQAGRGIELVLPVRPAAASGLPGQVMIERIDGTTDWTGLLEKVDVVIHCAARVHVMHESGADPLAAFRAVNVEGTLNLARAAAQAGVRRFIFLSSVKVHGESTAGRPFRADDRPAPADPYGVSKLEAEQALQELARLAGMQWVVIRPPLVYGPGVKANFHTMLRWVRAGVPLPFGALRNRRSLIALDNLVSLIEVCTWHPDADGQVLLASDGVDLSTADLLLQLAQGMDRPSRLVRVPPVVLGVAASVVGRKHLWQRLGGSLCVDMEPTRRLLGWTPPVDAGVALQRTARAFVAGEGW